MYGVWKGVFLAVNYNQAGTRNIIQDCTHGQGGAITNGISGNNDHLSAAKSICSIWDNIA